MKTIPVGKHEVIVDDWNYERVKGLKLNAHGQSATSGGVHAYWSRHKKRVGPDNPRYFIPLSKIILLTDAPMVDHKDRNWLNFQVENLRPCTKSQNQANHAKHKFKDGRPQTSRFKGVMFDKRRQRWFINVKKIGKAHYGGSFTEELEAARAYDALATKLHGEFALLNFPI